jgi:cytochrome d ubiquinol oxidase subunit II
MLRVTAALFIAGVGFLSIAEAGWAHAIGVFSLAGFMVVGFVAIVPRDLGEE